jgi:hypothetical protein
LSMAPARTMVNSVFQRAGPSSMDRPLSQIPHSLCRADWRRRGPWVVLMLNPPAIEPSSVRPLLRSVSATGEETGFSASSSPPTQPTWWMVPHPGTGIGFATDRGISTVRLSRTETCGSCCLDRSATYGVLQDWVIWTECIFESLQGTIHLAEC